MRQVVGARDLPACSMEGIRWKTLEERLKRKLCERAFDLVRMSHSQQIQQDVDDSECLLCCYRIYSAVEGWELLRSPSRTNIIAILGRIKTRIGDVSGLKNLQTEEDSGVSVRNGWALHIGNTYGGYPPKKSSSFLEKMLAKTQSQRLEDPRQSRVAQRERQLRCVRQVWSCKGRDVKEK